MKVLLTGANGFVGSRILARLSTERIPTAILVRSRARCDLIQPWIHQVEVHVGSLGEASSLDAALVDVTHVVHCAGKTKAVRIREYDEVNLQGTGQLLEALRRRRLTLERLVHLSSLAASHAAGVEAPAREIDPAQPVSAYGASKLAAEHLIQQRCPNAYVILRPSAVYGPGDTDFLKLFKSVRHGLCPQFGGGRQPLSLVYVDDLAEVVAEVLTRDHAAGEIFHVAHQDYIRAGELTRVITRAMHRRVRPLNLPWSVLGLACGLGDLAARMTGRPGILSRERYRELRAPGWVCDSSKLQHRLGLRCRTSLTEGIGATLAWYREHRWL